MLVIQRKFQVQVAERTQKKKEVDIKVVQAHGRAAIE
jgi:hypothetical protein